MKNKKLLIITAVSVLTLTTLVGFSDTKTELMGGNYVKSGKVHLEIDKPKFVEVDNDQIYFIADGSNENITEYCSAEDYYVKQLTIDGYIHTVAVGGDISNNISQEGGIDELGFLTHVKLIGETPNELGYDNEDALAGGINQESMYRYPSNENVDSSEIPVWLENVLQDYNLEDYKIE